MDNFSAVIHSSQLKMRDPIVTKKLAAGIKAEFIWDLPSLFSLPASDKWAVRY